MILVINGKDYYFIDLVLIWVHWDTYSISIWKKVSIYIFFNFNRLPKRLKTLFFLVIFFNKIHHFLLNVLLLYCLFLFIYKEEQKINNSFFHLWLPRWLSWYTINKLKKKRSLLFSLDVFSTISKEEKSIFKIYIPDRRRISITEKSNPSPMTTY